MEGLTQLTIRFPIAFNSTIDERVLINIDIYLPNLQLLRINRQIKTALNGYQLIAESLSRLSKLQKINVRVKGKSMQKMFETKIIKNCTKIISFNFKTLFEDPFNSI